MQLSALVEIDELFSSQELVLRDVFPALVAIMRRVCPFVSFGVIYGDEGDCLVATNDDDDVPLGDRREGARAISVMREAWSFFEDPKAGSLDRFAALSRVQPSRERWVCLPLTTSKPHPLGLLAVAPSIAPSVENIEDTLSFVAVVARLLGRVLEREKIEQDVAARSQRLVSAQRAILVEEREARERAESLARTNAYLVELTTSVLTRSDPLLMIHDLQRYVSTHLACECVVDIRGDALEHGHRSDAHAQLSVEESEGEERDERRRVELLSTFAPLIDQVLSHDRSTAVGVDVEALRSDDLIVPEAEALTRKLAPNVDWIVAAPIHTGGTAAGALVLFGATARRAPLATDLVERLATRLGAAIDNGRMYADALRALRARDEVLSIVSHDLKNPLGVILMSAANVLGRAPAAAEPSSPVFGYRELEAIQRNARRMRSLVADLLDFGAIQAGTLSMNPSPCRAQNLIAEAIDEAAFFAADRGVSLIVKDEVGIRRLPTAFADPNRIGQVLINTITNAIKFTRKGGTVTIGASFGTAPQQDSHDADPLSPRFALTFTVADTGVGIAEDALPHVFDRYWKASSTRLSGDGSGLGLAICKSIVELSKGQIWLESTLGKGTRVSFTVPAILDVTDIP